MTDIFTYTIYISLLILLISLVSPKFLIRAYKTADNSIFIDFSKENKLFFNHLIALFLISIIVGFRYEVGVDWRAYKNVFDFIKNNSSFSYQDQYMEWGYFAINKIISVIGGSYELMFFTVAFLSWFFIFKSVPNILLPLVIYFLFVDEIFFWSMNGVRQFVAISIFIYATRFIISRNIIKYFVLIAFAAMFHFSVIFMIPFYFVPFGKLYNQKIWAVAFIVSFFFAQTPFLVDSLQIIYFEISKIIPFLSTYTRYLDTGSLEAQELVVGLGYIFRQLVAVVILFFSKSAIQKYPQTKIYFILYFLGAIFFNLFFMFQLIGRLNNYFLIFRSIVLAIVVYHLWEIRKYRNISILLVVSYFFLYLSQIYNSSNGCSPYNFSF